MRLCPFPPHVHAAVLAMVAAVATGPLAAQGAELVLEPVESPALRCDQLTLEVRLERIVEPVWGYQLFLRFPATALRPLAYMPEALGATLFRAGPAPFGTGFAGCSSQVTDPWDDGLGDDVLAVAATAIASGKEETGGALPLTAADAPAVLGRLVFDVLAPASATATLALDTAPCHPVLDQTTRLFGGDGEALDADLPGPTAVALPPVAALQCEPVPEGVRLSWSLRGGAEPAEIRVRRNGELVATLPGGSVTYDDRDTAGLERARYEVVAVRAGGVETCAAACTVELGPERSFIRGDVDGGGSVNITDAVGVLRHLFSGAALSCADAADFDDDGQITITDAIFGLNFLFGAGPAIPPPSGEPGPDPTFDTLGC